MRRFHYMLWYKFNNMKPILSYLLLLPLVWLSPPRSVSNVPAEIVLVASTPGDEVMKSLLEIPRNTKIDFIRWNIVLNSTDADRKHFTIDIVFGESQPNTLGFKGGGQKWSVTGQYTQESSSKINGNVYRLQSRSLPTGLGIVKLTDNIFHFLTPEDRLMVGNGGWSYTLCRRDPVDSPITLPALFRSTAKAANEAEVVFDGRTPCQEIAAEHPEMRVSQACFKLKWRLILRRDASGHPTTYTIRKVVDGSARNITGKWAITHGTESNPDVTIYTTEPDKPEESISFLVGDENVLFFLRKDNTPYVGNKDFSFTLNRKVD